MLAAGSDDEELKTIWGNNKWLCEEKLDGSRYILQFNHTGEALLTSRKISVKNDLPVNKTENLRGYVVNDCPELAGTVLDGEIVGGSSFGNTVTLMGSSPERSLRLLKDGFAVKYCVYDILQFKGKNVKTENLQIRKKYLRKALSIYNNPLVSYVEALPNNENTYRGIVSRGGEGVILKRVYSNYYEGERNKGWLKVKKSDTYDGVILGFTEGQGKYATVIGSIVVGQLLDGTMTEVATISGMNDEDRLKFSENKKDFVGMCVEFKAQQKTEARYRHPVFIRLRPDKSPNQCVF